MTPPAACTASAPSVVNALSEWMEVEVARDKHAYKMRFERGHAVGKLKDLGAVNRRGTIVSFKPDAQDFRRHRISRRRGCTAWPSPRPICSAAWKSAGPAIPSLIKDETPAEDVLKFPGGLLDFLQQRDRQGHAPSRRAISAGRTENKKRRKHARRGGMGGDLGAVARSLHPLLLQHHPHARRAAPMNRACAMP